MCPLRQFKKIPDEIIRKIEKKNIAWDRFYDLGAHEIGMMLEIDIMAMSYFAFL